MAIRCVNRGLASATLTQREDTTLFLPSEFVENFFYLPIGNQLQKFSFKDRPYFYESYDTDYPNILLKCARQVGKSTYLSNQMLALVSLIQFFKVLYVSPTNTQTTQFSNDRIRTTIDYSEWLRALENPGRVRRILHKAFHNGSEIRLRYAFFSADRIRGIMTDLLTIDEIQDVLWPLIPVIEQTLFTSMHKIRLYAGTPRSTSNTIEHVWNLSTQQEWLVPCDACGSKVKGSAGRYWNILGEKNIGKDGIICARCEKPINPRHVDSSWEPRNPHPVASNGKKIEKPFIGYHISQLMHPMTELGWQELKANQQGYSRALFHNECLGLSYDSGLRPITRANLKANCDERYTMAEHREGFEYSLQFFEKWVKSGHPCFMGVDWGTAEGSYTVMTLGTYLLNQKFTIFYVKRFLGVESEPDPQILDLVQWARRFGVKLVGADYGGGFDRNYRLAKTLGHRSLVRYQYSDNLGDKIRWSHQLDRFMVNRTEVMSDIFNSLNRGDVIALPRWEDIEQPHAQDVLNIYGEHDHVSNKLVYNVAPGETDDTFHSILYCFLASMLLHPRPDIIRWSRAGTERQFSRS